MTRALSTRRLTAPFGLAAAAAWGVAALLEANTSIFVAAVAALTIALVVTRLVGRRAPAAMTVFTIGYVLRTAAALAAFYAGKGEEYWVGGVGSDALAYYTTSFLDLGDALFEFTYRGFVAYNNFVTHAALAFDNAHYLCNLQGPLVAGALLPVLAYGVLRELRDERTGRTVAVVLACHPSMVAISAVLLRDTLVGAFGWAAIYLLVLTFQARSVHAATLLLSLLAGMLYVLSLLRFQSLLVFLALAFVLNFFRSTGAESSRTVPAVVRRGALILIAVVAVVGVATFLAGRMPAGLTSTYFQDVVEYRLQNASQGSLGVALASGNVAVSTAVYSALALLAPFPFYAWSPAVLGHPTGPLDYLIGLGGLVNQFIIALFVVGVARSLRRRDALSVAAVACIVGFVVVTVLGGGDTIRYVAVHVFPLYVMVALEGARAVRHRSTVLLPWLGALATLYTLYESLKSGMERSYVMLAVTILLLYVGTYLLYAWSTSGQQVHPSRPMGAARLTGDVQRRLRT